MRESHNCSMALYGWEIIEHPECAMPKNLSNFSYTPKGLCAEHVCRTVHIQSNFSAAIGFLLQLEQSSQSRSKMHLHMTPIQIRAASIPNLKLALGKWKHRKMVQNMANLCYYKNKSIENFLPWTLFLLHEGSKALFGLDIVNKHVRLLLRVLGA